MDTGRCVSGPGDGMCRGPTAGRPRGTDALGETHGALQAEFRTLGLSCSTGNTGQGGEGGAFRRPQVPAAMLGFLSTCSPQQSSG